VFEGITVLYMGSERVKVLNMKPIHYKVLSLLGNEYERMYCTGYGSTVPHAMCSVAGIA